MNLKSGLQNKSKLQESRINWQESRLIDKNPEWIYKNKE